MIRPLRPADFYELLEIEAQAFPKSQYDRGQLWILYLKYPNTFLLEVSDQIDGYIVFSPNGHIISMAVRPEHRRKGIGTSLVQEAIDHCTEKSLRLEVRVSNVGAQKFYQTIGFRITACIHSYYQDGEDAFIMERPATESKGSRSHDQPCGAEDTNR